MSRNLLMNQRLATVRKLLEHYQMLIRPEGHLVEFKIPIWKQCNAMSGHGDNGQAFIDQSEASIWWITTEQGGTLTSDRIGSDRIGFSTGRQGISNTMHSTDPSHSRLGMISIKHDDFTSFLKF